MYKDIQGFGSERVPPFFDPPHVKQTPVSTSTSCFTSFHPASLHILSSTSTLGLHTAGEFIKLS